MNRENILSIFINYRRDDCADQALIFSQALGRALGEQAEVFFDQKSIQLTDDWKAVLRAEVRRAEVMLSLIGPHWEKGFLDKQKKDASDWVLFEIETARAEHIDIIPVYLERDGEKIDDRGLPEAAAELKTRQGFSAKRGGLAAAIDQLIDTLRALNGEKPAEAAAAKTLPLLACLPLPSRYAEEKLYETDAQGNPLVAQPFLGPTYFPEQNAALYFGRDRDIRRLYHLARRHRLVLLDGYSGSGKSSLLHAGLLPRWTALPGWTIAQPIVRRNKQAGGLHRQLAEHLEQLPQDAAPEQRSLLILDQVEEMYTDPLPADASEPEALGLLLQSALAARPGLHVILAFRSEYQRKIAGEFIPKYRLAAYARSMYLGPMDREGIARAIMGPAQFPFKFNYAVDRAVAEKIAADYTGDDFSPHTVLLQVQLVELWKAASEAARQANRRDLRFTEALYEQTPKKDLPAFIEDRLREIQTGDDWAAAYHSGLLLAMLHDFTTPMGTAASLGNAAFCRRYGHIQSPAPAAVLDALQRVYLLSAAGVDGASTRMAHDSLARIIRRQFEESDRPGQKAWRILAPKLKDTQSHQFSESDVELILAGENGMPALDEPVRAKLLADLGHYREQRRQNFDLAFATAEKNIAHIEHAEAARNLLLAARENLDPARVREKTLELLYPLALLGQKDETASCLRLLETLQNEPFTLPATLRPEALPDGVLPIGTLETAFPDLPERLRERYFPQLADIPGGAFDMGSEEGYDDEKPLHRVTVSGFRMARTPVTCWQYGLFCQDAGNRPLPRDSGFGRGDKPVINVHWYEALEYCNWLSRREGLDEVYEIIPGTREPAVTAHWERNGYRLPTEAEWEFAARAVRTGDGPPRGGGAVRFGNGQNSARDSEMNFDAGHPYNTQNYVEKGRMRGETTPVKTFPPNPLGLYDMSGNVLEWCWDFWSEGETHFYRSSQDSVDPTGPETGSSRVVRGGSWLNVAVVCRCSYRYGLHPTDTTHNIGFRVVRRL